MSEREREIEVLLTQKLLGLLPEKEAHEVDLLIQNDEKVAALWQAMQAKADNLIPPTDWAPAHTLFKDQVPVRRIRWKPVTVAALSLGIIVFAYLGITRFKTKEKSSMLAVTERPAEKQGILLKTADGQEYVLGKPGSKSVTEMVQSDAAAVAGLNSISVPATMTYSFTLPDGSVVELNSGSTISFPVKFAAQREVSVTGEAKFNVVKKNGQRFIVHLPTSDVTVLGTVFNVNTYDSSTETVALYSGSVRIKKGPDSVLIRPGEQAHIDRNSIAIQSFNEFEVDGWTKGLYYFNNSKLSSLSNIVSRWWGYDIIIENDNINSRLISGTLDKNNPIDTLVGTLRLLLPDSRTSVDRERHLIHIK